VQGLFFDTFLEIFLKKLSLNYRFSKSEPGRRAGERKRIRNFCVSVLAGGASLRLPQFLIAFPDFASLTCGLNLVK